MARPCGWGRRDTAAPCNHLFPTRVRRRRARPRNHCNAFSFLLQQTSEPKLISYDDIVRRAAMMAATRQIDLSACIAGGAFMKSFIIRVLFAALITTGAHTASMAADQAYPNHPLRIVVPFAPAGASD